MLKFISLSLLLFALPVVGFFSPMAWAAKAPEKQELIISSTAAKTLSNWDWHRAGEQAQWLVQTNLLGTSYVVYKIGAELEMFTQGVLLREDPERIPLSARFSANDGRFYMAAAYEGSRVVLVKELSSGQAFQIQLPSVPTRFFFAQDRRGTLYLVANDSKAVRVYFQHRGQFLLRSELRLKSNIVHVDGVAADEIGLVVAAATEDQMINVMETDQPFGSTLKTLSKPAEVYLKKTLNGPLQVAALTMTISPTSTFDPTPARLEFFRMEHEASANLSSHQVSQAFSGVHRIIGWEPETQLEMSPGLAMWNDEFGIQTVAIFRPFSRETRVVQRLNYEPSKLEQLCERFLGRTAPPVRVDEIGPSFSVRSADWLTQASWETAYGKSWLMLQTAKNIAVYDPIAKHSSPIGQFPRFQTQLTNRSRSPLETREPSHLWPNGDLNQVTIGPHRHPTAPQNRLELYRVPARRFSSQLRKRQQ